MTQIRHGTLHEPWSLVVDMQDVAVGILEPGGLELSGNVDVAFAPESRRVIMFERNTGLLKITHDGVHFFADSPSCGRSLVAPGKLRLVDDDCRIAASQRDNAGPFFAAARSLTAMVAMASLSASIFNLLDADATNRPTPTDNDRSAELSNNGNLSAPV